MSNLEGIKTRHVEDLERGPRHPVTLEDLRSAEERAIFELRLKLAATAVEQKEKSK